MTLWTTFSPGKISWELTYIHTKGNTPTGNWLHHQDLIKQSLHLLKSSGVSGIRLVIFPSELTTDGKRYNWTPVETMLSLCQDTKIKVILCIGPFQFPYYPGIYLPKNILEIVFDTPRCLDTTPELWNYGERFLELQMERFGQDKRVYGFHLANEWPSEQNVAGKEKIKTCISSAFMLATAKRLKESTDKPMLLNTNIDAADKSNLKKTFTELLTLLGDQGKLGFDIYPSQETWKKVPLQKLGRLFEPFPRSFSICQKIFPDCELYFAEVEAQPWGGGQAWYTLINNEENPDKRVLLYSQESLKKTWDKHILPTQPNMVSLWGADFWLSANEMGITWPLEEVKKISTGNWH